MPLSEVQPAHYQQQLEEKCERLHALFAPHQAPPAQVFASPPLHFRMRAEFRIWRDGDALHYAMFHPDSPRTPVPIGSFPIAHRHISDLMQPLLAACAAETALRHHLFQVGFLTTLSGDTLVTLIYHRPLDEAWEKAARPLAARFGISVIGRSRKQKRVIGRDYVEERLETSVGNFLYRQYEGSFSQPNALVNQQMLNWACAQAKRCGGDLLELYCGNGNFTLPLARCFPKVLATEVAKTSVRAARENLSLNGNANIALARLSSAEIASALRGDRQFRRLADIRLEDYQLRSVFVDPPRAGLDPLTRSLLTRFDNIIYISCNPQTQERDIRELGEEYRIKTLALFDQFPYTSHVECGVLLQKAGGTDGNEVQ